MSDPIPRYCPAHPDQVSPSLCVMGCEDRACSLRSDPVPQDSTQGPIVRPSASQRPLEGQQLTCSCPELRKSVPYPGMVHPVYVMDRDVRCQIHGDPQGLAQVKLDLQRAIEITEFVYTVPEGACERRYAEDTRYAHGEAYTRYRVLSDLEHQASHEYDSSRCVEDGVRCSRCVCPFSGAGGSCDPDLCGPSCPGQCGGCTP